MGVVIGADDALERVWLLDTRQGRRTATGRWGSRHLREADAALAQGRAERDQQRSGYQW